MNPIGDQSATSPYGVIRDAQKAMAAGMLRLIDGAAQSGNAPPAAPIQAAPTRGSSVHVIA